MALISTKANPSFYLPPLIVAFCRQGRWAIAPMPIFHPFWLLLFCRQGCWAITPMPIFYPLWLLFFCAEAIEPSHWCQLRWVISSPRSIYVNGSVSLRSFQSHYLFNWRDTLKELVSLDRQAITQLWLRPLQNPWQWWWRIEQGHFHRWQRRHVHIALRFCTHIGVVPWWNNSPCTAAKMTRFWARN